MSTLSSTNSARSQQRHKLPSELLFFVDEPAAHDCWPAFFIDLSATGAKFLIHRRHWVEGELIPIQMLSRGSCRRYTKAMRVIHAQKGASHYWVIGGAFLRPLTQAELSDIIGTQELDRPEERKYSWWDKRAGVASV